MQKRSTISVAVRRLRECLLRRHRLDDAGRDTECSGCAVPDGLRGDFHDRLFRRLRAARRAGSLRARGRRVRAGALLPRHRPRLGNYSALRLGRAGRIRDIVTVFSSTRGDSSDAEGDIQGAPVHGRPVPRPAHRILAAPLRLLLPLHDGGGDLRHRLRYERLQLDRRHRHRDGDNGTARPAVPPDGGHVLQSAVSTVSAVVDVATRAASRV